ncbi:unnamed protein product [Clonostachys chloroleuca]|uniref:Heterokaryon incompatibility domain-containing protein n=1 Tax=Clonostachys chloroleuca TaxID=1926264 RepID=A0AA35Q0W5_9HYPO|nr:unnamed protein product [Clonostachys chloroleuca]
MHVLSTLRASIHDAKTGTNSVPGSEKNQLALAIRDAGIPFASTPSLVDDVCSLLASRTKLCHICQSFSSQLSSWIRKPTFDELLQWPERDYAKDRMAALSDGYRLLPPERVDPTTPRPSNVFEHHKAARDLLKSAKNCRFCELLKLAIALDSNRSLGFPYDKTTTPLGEILVQYNSRSGGSDVANIIEGLKTSADAIYLMVEPYAMGGYIKSVGYKSALGNIRVIWQKPKRMLTEDTRAVVFTRLNIYTTHNNSALLPFISTRQPLHNSGSPDAMALIREWFSGCRSRHGECCRRTVSRQVIPEDELHVLPSRVIDVGLDNPNQDPHLVENQDKTVGQWVALSHCWGKEKNHPLKTTRRTLALHLKAIPMSSMPKTFRDAVAVCRSLGQRFLWIDSLCIVQDDEDEWEKESQLMGTVYEHAVLTLAASDAIDSTRGLFLERPYADIRFPSIQLLLLTAESDTGRQTALGSYSVGIDWRQEPFMIHLHPHWTPLARRGWCTQELILSRRVVHFLREGMLWVCRDKAEDENGQMVYGRLTERDWSTEWGKIILEHSQREFSFEKDRLRSLDGLAKELSKVKNNSCNTGEYFYGTWLADIPEYILWASYRAGKKNTRCPSWTWASCEGAVWFRFRDFDNLRQDDFSQCCKVLGVSKSTGVLTVEGKVADISHLILYPMRRNSTEDLMGQNSNVTYRQPLVQGYAVGSRREEPYGWIEFDDNRDALAMPEPILFVHLADGEYYTPPLIQHWGLILVKEAGSDSRYSRIGMGSLWDSELFAGLIASRVEII